MEEEARLIILKELFKEDNKAMSSSRMQAYLLTHFLIDKPREWVEAQFSYLKDMGAVSVISRDTVKIARMDVRGEYHLSGMVLIAGVMPASARPE